MVQVIAMRRRHLRGVVAIERVANPRPWSLQLFESELKQRSSRAFVAISGRSVVVGYGCMLSTGSETHITNLAVDPAQHRGGVATRLLLAMMHETTLLGLDDVTLEVRAGNEAAQALYRSFGFVVEGLRPRYYAESNEDAVIMWARAISSPEFRCPLRGRGACVKMLAGEPVTPWCPWS